MINRQVVFTDKWKVELQRNELEEKAIREDQFLVKTRFSLISPGTELACLSGSESRIHFPFNPGYTAVGEVVETGNDLEDYKKGDIVFWYGKHQDYSVVAPKEVFCVKVPEDLDLKLIPFVRMATIAMTALRESDIEIGDWVGVTGQGIVGNLAAQFAALQGANVIALDVAEDRLKMSRRCGIAHTLLSGRDDTVQRIRELTSGCMLNSLIEATGIPSVAVSAVDYLKKRGELILLGTPRGEFVTDVTGLLRSIHLADSALSLKPAHEWIYPVKADPFVKHSFERNTRIIFDLIREKRLNIHPILTHVLRPENAEQAYMGLKDEKNRYTGVVFDWN